MRQTDCRRKAISTPKSKERVMNLSEPNYSNRGTVHDYRRLVREREEIAVSDQSVEDKERQIAIINGLLSDCDRPE
jgi:hypothetical protein